VVWVVVARRDGERKRREKSQERRRRREDAEHRGTIMTQVEETTKERRGIMKAGWCVEFVVSRSTFGNKTACQKEEKSEENLTVQCDER